MSLRSPKTILAGPEENKGSINHMLCLICASIFIRPDEDWDDNQRTQICYKNRAINDVRSSAKSGCMICEIFHKAILSSPDIKRKWQEEHGMSCFLHWNQTTGRFEDFLISSAEASIQLLLEEEVEFLGHGTRDNTLNTSSDASWDLMSRWLTDCVQYHQKCNHRSQSETWLPARLIDIGISKENCVPRLVLPSEAQFGIEIPTYISLSHRWNSRTTAKLTSKNITRYQQEIPMDDLPAIFKDSIEVARHLNVRYIWIDSLCILQDSDLDWQRESAAMGKVYENSYCNVAATAAAEGYERIFVNRDPSSVSSFKIDVKWKGHEQSYYCLYRGFWHLGITKTVLNRRGWVLQERLLSPRTLAFNRQLFWECRELKACEAFPFGLRQAVSFEPEDVDDDSELCPKSWETDVTASVYKYAHWTKIVEQFMVSGLTEGTDKLIALSGVAERMKSLLGDNYFAGLWQQNLLFDLLWYIEKGRQANWESSFRVDPYRAPSWSWASVEGRVHFPRGRLDISWGHPLLEVCAIEVETATDDNTGQVKDGFILVSGILKRMSEFCDLPEHVFDMMPGAGTACCVDDEVDFSLIDLFVLPVRVMRSINGEELLCLMLTPILNSTEVFRRVGLLALKQDELHGFEWATDEWNTDGGSRAHLLQRIKIV